MNQLMNHSPHSTIKRAPKRASYDIQKVTQLVNEVKLGHLGFISDNRPVIIPITLWAVDQHLYFHVANKSRLQKMLEQGNEICVSVAQTDEWVMAKSAYHHSANYRSAVLFCTGTRVINDVDFDHAFKEIINNIEPDRWEKVRAPSKQERKGTALMKLTINEGSFKARTGGATDEKEDMDLPVWSGVISACPFHK
ncbi:pyridoxamine 5'-phosphate oxidase family protein [Marinicellulosiphila megalodicopiae]|uniref:pyridoxamine 5'-phosphate oxidase family protein n=1 Tax=Marinicellulosiphila megalodicopiae TaxID=2724896 RepID=UPI003BB1525D